MIFSDFQLKSFVHPKPVELGECYISLNLNPNLLAQCSDTSNFIFAIKQGGLGKTLEVYNSLLAQRA